jgi:hypothetical protein
MQSTTLGTFKEPRNRFQGFEFWLAGTTNRVIVSARKATPVGGIDSLESIPGLLERLQILALEEGETRQACTQLQQNPFAANCNTKQNLL